MNGLYSLQLRLSKTLEQFFNAALQNRCCKSRFNYSSKQMQLRSYMNDQCQREKLLSTISSSGSGTIAILGTPSPDMVRPTPAIATKAAPKVNLHGVHHHRKQHLINNICFFNDQRLSYITIKFGAESIFSHKVILSQNSDYFMRMFCGEFKVRPTLSNTDGPSSG